MATIKIEIRNCKQCPHVIEKGNQSPDGFNLTVNWRCGLTDVTIQNNIKWYEESKVQIPKWCPIKL